MAKKIIEVHNHTTFKVKKIERVVKNIRNEGIDTVGEIKYEGKEHTVYIDSYGDWCLDVN